MKGIHQIIANRDLLVRKSSELPDAGNWVVCLEKLPVKKVNLKQYEAKEKQNIDLHLEKMAQQIEKAKKLKQNLAKEKQNVDLAKGKQNVDRHLEKMAQEIEKAKKIRDDLKRMAQKVENTKSLGEIKKIAQQSKKRADIEDLVPIKILKTDARLIPKLSKIKIKPIQKTDLKLDMNAPSRVVVRCGRDDERNVLNKHRENIQQVLLCTNATPINRGGPSYSCCFCDNHYPNPQELKEHNLIDHTDDERRTFKNYTGMYSFIAKVDITDLQCKLCNSSIDKLEDLFIHLKDDHNKKIHLDIDNYIVPYKFDDGNLKCAVCQREYYAFKKLQEHMNSHYSNHVCKFCSVGFVNNQMLARHLTIHAISENKFECPHCSKVFNNIGGLNLHNKHVHSQQKQVFACSLCDEKFDKYRARIIHLSKVHGVKVGEYKCKACDRSFITSGSLTYHIQRDHLMLRKFECEICPVKCYSKNELTAHMVTHTGSREFQCDYCQKSFGRKKTLKEHMRIHLNDRRFECVYCGLRFVQKVSLRGHLRSRHDKVE